MELCEMSGFIWVNLLHLSLGHKTSKKNIYKEVKLWDLLGGTDRQTDMYSHTQTRDQSEDIKQCKA